MARAQGELRKIMEKTSKFPTRKIHFHYDVETNAPDWVLDAIAETIKIAAGDFNNTKDLEYPDSTKSFTVLNTGWEEYHDAG